MIHYHLKIAHLKTGISEKYKTVDQKNQQNQSQFDLHGQTAKISALSSGVVSKYKFLTGKHVLPEKDLLVKAATIKMFKYLPLTKELKQSLKLPRKSITK